MLTERRNSLRLPTSLRAIRLTNTYMFMNVKIRIRVTHISNVRQKHIFGKTPTIYLCKLNYINNPTYQSIPVFHHTAHSLAITLLTTNEMLIYSHFLPQMKWNHSHFLPEHLSSSSVNPYQTFFVQILIWHNFESKGSITRIKQQLSQSGDWSCEDKRIKISPCEYTNFWSGKSSQ